MTRDFKKQFEPKTVSKINKLIRRIKNLPLSNNVSYYYAHDLILCLKTGALLGALHVAAALLEVLIRETYETHIFQTSLPKNKKIIKLQKKIEENRYLGFSQLVDHLNKSGLLKKTGAQKLKKFYNAVRIPIHHGLPIRFIKAHDKHFSTVVMIKEIFDLPIAMREFEETIEDYSLPLIEKAIEIIEKFLL